MKVLGEILGRRKSNLKPTPDDIQLEQDWQRARTIDGYPVFERTRKLGLDKHSLMESRVKFSIELGGLAVGGHSFRMTPRDGSTMNITATRSSIDLTSPAGEITELAEGEESASMKVGYEQTITMSVLAPPLRNPIGKTFHHAASWGPLPWMVGIIAAIVGTVFRDGLTAAVRNTFSSTWRLGRRRRLPVSPRPPPPRNTPPSPRNRREFGSWRGNDPSPGSRGPRHRRQE